MNRGAWQAIYSSWGRKESDTTERLSMHTQPCENKEFIKERYIQERLS